MSASARNLSDETDLAEFIRDRGPHCLIVSRHGETAWNAEGRLQGQQDVPLNSRGRSQSLAAAVYINFLVRTGLVYRHFRSEDSAES